MPVTDPARLRSLASHSLAVIRDGQSSSGAYVASPTFPVYRYSWFRDGAFIADAMSRAGEIDSAEAFFGWCARVLNDRTTAVHELLARSRAGERIPPGDFLHTRYTLDGADSPERWETFQLVGYGAWLWALDNHAHRHRTSVEPYREAIALSVEYLVEFWSEPCYDWWEEHVAERHTSTLAAIHAGLRAAKRLEALPTTLAARADTAAIQIREAVETRGIHQGRLTKWLDGTDLDASLIACATPQVIPLSLNDPVGLKPWCLKASASSPP